MTHILKNNFDSSFKARLSQFMIYGDAHIYESYMSVLSGVVDTLEPGIHNTHTIIILIHLIIADVNIVLGHQYCICHGKCV